MEREDIMGNVLYSAEMISCKLLNQLVQKRLALWEEGKRGKTWESGITLEKKGLSRN